MTISYRQAEIVREQIELCFYIGYPGVVHRAFKAQCIDTATHLCGGCFVADGTGYWREGASQRATRFHGRQVEERTLGIYLTTELAKETEVLAAMRAGIVQAARNHGLQHSIQWVHVQRIPITGLHFSINEEFRQAA